MGKLKVEQEKKAKGQRMAESFLRQSSNGETRSR